MSRTRTSPARVPRSGRRWRRSGRIALPRRRRSPQPWRRWTWPTARSSRARIRTAACVPEASARCGPSTRSNATSSIRRPRRVRRPSSTRSVPAVLIETRQKTGAPAVSDRHRRAAPRRQQARPRHRSGRHEHAARTLRADGRSGWRESPGRRRRRPAHLAAAVEGVTMDPQPRLAIVATIQQAITTPADDLRTGVPPLRVLALRGVRHDPASRGRASG